MGKASRIELPDPLEASPAAAGETDDLLSQLAGEEIDRLLAASDVEREPAPVSPPPATSPLAASPASAAAPAPIPPQSARQVQPAHAAGSIKPAETRVAAPSGPPVRKLAAADVAVAADLDAAFEQQTKGVYRPAASPTRPAAPRPPAEDFAGAIAVATTAARAAPASPPVPKAFEGQNASAPATVSAPADAGVTLAAAGVVSAPAASAAGVFEAEASIAASERAALDLPSPELDLQQAMPDASSGPRRVRLLQRLAAPLAALPDALHDAAGKIAILTLINAVAILAYVVIFRRH